MPAKFCKDYFRGMRRYFSFRYFDVCEIFGYTPSKSPGACTMKTPQELIREMKEAGIRQCKIAEITGIVGFISERDQAWKTLRRVVSAVSGTCRVSQKADAGRAA